MAKSLHPKIQALRSSIGHIPIHIFRPNRKKYEEVDIKKRSPEVGTKEDDREIRQYFCIFGIPDDYRTEPIKGSFKKSIDERGPKSNAPQKILVLNQHDQRNPLCLPSEIYEDEIGLFGRYTPDEGIVENDTLVKRIKRGTINGGSYGFNYVWDKMEYDDKTDTIKMFEIELYEISPVTFGSQKETFVVRNKNGILEDTFLEDETEEFIKNLPRKQHLQIRSLIARHISLAKLQQPHQQKRNALNKSKPKQGDEIDYEYLLNNL